MNMYEKTTIAAIATAPGDGGIAVIRISGADAAQIMEKIFRPKKFGAIKQNELRYGAVVSDVGEMIDEAMCAYMKAPKSYTREDVVEIQCHGGQLSARRVLNAVLSAGAELAEPGEFTKRAFLNGRIDLSKAEAVMALIRAGGEAAARAAVRQLEGGVSRFVLRQAAALQSMLAAIEAANDFPDEIDEESTREELLEGIDKNLSDLLAATDERGARIVREGLSVALVGKPNVGKSSLMNAMLGIERAIVTYMPGTTRDVLTERIKIGGIVLELSDTAGQRRTDDPIEAIGVQRAESAEKNADVVLLVLDAAEKLDAAEEKWLGRTDSRYIVVINKSDAEGILIKKEDIERLTDCPVLCLSARTGEGMSALYELIAKRGGAMEETGAEKLTELRHLALAKKAAEALARAESTLLGGMPVDLAAVDLWDALHRLTEITGGNATEDVVAGIFQNFCVGK